MQLTAKLISITPCKFPGILTFSIFLKGEECKDYKIEIIDAPIVDISSTEIREGIAAGRDMKEWMM